MFSAAIQGTSSMRKGSTKTLDHVRVTSTWLASCCAVQRLQPSLVAKMSSKVLLLVEGISFFILILLSVSLYVCESRGVSYKRGFFCDDETIRLPYKDGTVPSYALVIISAALPVIIVSNVDSHITSRHAMEP